MSTLVPTICASCAELLVSPAITEPHENLMPQYQFTKTPGHRPDGDYTCLECESIWELRFEKNELSGASLVNHKGTRTSSAIAACPQPFHHRSNAGSCQVVQRARRHGRVL